MERKKYASIKSSISLNQAHLQTAHCRQTKYRFLGTSKRTIKNAESKVDTTSKDRTTGGNSTYTQAGVLCFLGQESGKFKVQFFVGEVRWLKSLPAYSCNPLITDENGIYTNGGAYSFLNLIIYLVEKYFDRQAAIFCSKVFQIEMDRHSQSEFIIFKGQKSHGDEKILKAQTYIETNPSEKISMEELSSNLAVSRRNFDRRFIKATGNTPVEYVQRVKVEIAKRAFETNRKTINEVMYEIGYNDVKAFREVFRKITGMSPLEYRNKYNKDTHIN